MLIPVEEDGTALKDQSTLGKMQIIIDYLSLLQKYFINTTYSPFQKHFSSSYGLSTQTCSLEPLIQSFLCS
jgi:hypothetical protein